jgi:membrane-bound lytic murein transglycosylase
MQRRIITLWALLVAGLTAAACSSSPSATTGHESVSGTTDNISANALDVKATGPIDDTGHLTVSGNGSKAVIALSKGDIDVNHAKGTSTEHFDQATETLSMGNNGTFTVTGGTGAYKGVTGAGNFSVTFTGKYKPGTTEQHVQNAQPVSAQLSFHADGNWTVPH